MQLAYLMHFSSIRIDAQMYYIVLIFTYAYVQSSWLLSLLVLDPVYQVLNPNIYLMQLCMSLVSNNHQSCARIKTTKNTKKQQYYGDLGKTNGI